MSRLSVTLVGCLLALVLSACAGLKSPQAERRSTALDVATETYRKLMRWGYVEQAAEYLRAPDGEIARPNLANYAHYKITGYHQGDVLVNDEGDEARLVATIEYYEVDTGLARTLRDEQYWWYDEAEKRWFLGTPMPELEIVARRPTVRLTR